jgi:hypothetical protein
MIDSANFDSGEDEGDRSNELVDFVDCARLPVTQTDDPLSGGHLPLGTSKAPPWSARERRVVIHVGALEMAHGKHTRRSVARESPISNGLTAVGGANTKLLF